MDYKQVIESAYNRKNWQELLHDIFGRRITFFATPTRIDVNSDTAKSALYLGKIDLADGKSIAVYEVPLTESVVIERNKVSIRNLLVTHWRNSGFAGAFMFCFKENESVLRFSYVSEVLAFNEEGKLATEATDTKRFTYYLGEGHRSRTAIDQFTKLKGSGQTLDDITKAFSIEAVSDAFFAGYKNIYEDIVEYMTGKRMSKVDGKWKEVDVHAPNAEIAQEFAIFDNPLKAMRDYVKKLMGRLVFLQFLQKKGWLGVPASKEWGSGDREFMLNLYKASKYQNDFIESVLEPLFNDINTKRDGDLASNVNVGKDIKIPFLNGGLFERDKEDESTIKLPAKYFDNLFDFFSQYNFTIDENDPYDTEVGIDPEMLGRIFENLLEDNKDKGAFYTPKEIVRYMCAESLIAYLQTDMNDDKEKESVRNFVSTHEVAYLSQTLKPLVRKKIMDVKICDPAIGSGAFPIGLLNELFSCLESIDGEQANRAELKKHIIQNSIYGVDIEKGAVDIARLRFWLSLVVDEETPTALPNLDFKIMQGNSLLEQYCGVDLSNIMRSDDAFVQADAAELPEKLKQYYLPNSHEEKMKLHDEITVIVKNCIQSGGRNLPDIQVDGNDKFFLWHTWFSDVFNRPSGCNGFDIVIGNPPYVSSKSLPQKEKVLYKSLYSTADKQFDLFSIFIEKSVSLLKTKGITSFIVPDSLVGRSNFKSTRNLLIVKNEVLNWVHINDVFDSAIVSSLIYVCKKNKISNYEFTYIKASDVRNWYKGEVSSVVVSSTTVDKDENSKVYFAPQESVALRQKFRKYNSFEQECYLWRGEEIGKNASVIKSAREEKTLGVLTGSEVHRYEMPITKHWINYGDIIKECENYKKNKILIRQIGTIINATIDDDGRAFVQSVYGLYPYDREKANHLFLILGVLNSRLFDFFYKLISGDKQMFQRIVLENIKELPFPLFENSSCVSAIETLVLKILTYKKSNPQIDTSVLEAKIDKLVYTLFELTEEEIKIVESH